MSMNLKTSWACPECGERVPVNLEALTGTDGGARVKIRVIVPGAALADAFAHAWTHSVTGSDPTP